MKGIRVIICVFTAVCLLVLVQFIGCESDDDDRAPTSTPTVSETPTLTPTATPTVSETPRTGKGILNIWTTPVNGDIYVDGQWRGWGVWQGELPAGVYLVSFGDVAGCHTPDDVEAIVRVDETTHVEGDYMITFNKTFGGHSEDIGFSVHQNVDGGYIVTGSTKSIGAGDADVYLVRTDVFGNEMWTKTFGGPSEDVGYSVQQTSDGGFIIAGYTYSFGYGDADVYLIKTDCLGNRVWAKMFGGSQLDKAKSVQQTSDGGYIIAGTTRSFGSGFGYIYLIKTDANGIELWSKTYDKDVYCAMSVQQTSDGGYIIAAGEGIIYLLKTDGNGNETWTRIFYSGGGYEYCESVQQTSDGGYIITGALYYNAYYSYWYSLLIKTDSQGNELWSSYYANPSHGYSGRQTNDGGFVFTGGGNCLLKTDALGNEIWHTSFGSGRSYSVQQASDGGYVMTGYSHAYYPEGRDLLLIKTDPNGNI